MIEMHGWITLRDSFENVDRDDEEDRLKAIVDSVEKSIASLRWVNGLARVHNFNGTTYVILALNQNHWCQEVDEAFGLVDLVSEIAPGSFGMVYLHDDENAHGKDNAFQVFTLIRGEVVAHADPFFSPLIPTVEDEWDPTRASVDLGTVEDDHRADGNELVSTDSVAPEVFDAQLKTVLRVKRRSGVWTVPPELNITCVMGTVLLDFSEAVFSSNRLVISGRYVMGELTIQLPKGAVFVDETTSTLSRFIVVGISAPLADAPTIVLTGRHILNTVTVSFG